MSIQQAIDAARSVGLSGERLVLAVAIAGGESGWNSDNVYITSAEHSVGLWQINILAHPQYSEAWLKNPYNNASAMWEISGGGTHWQPWSVFTSGKWRQYENQARTSTGDAGTGSGSTPNPATNDAAERNYVSCMQAARLITDPTKQQEAMDKCEETYKRELAGQNEALDDSLVCPHCTGLDTIPECVVCFAQYFTTGLQNAGINIALALLVALGLYLFFREEANGSTA